MDLTSSPNVYVLVPPLPAAYQKVINKTNQEQEQEQEPSQETRKKKRKPRAVTKRIRKIHIKDTTLLQLTEHSPLSTQNENENENGNGNGEMIVTNLTFTQEGFLLESDHEDNAEKNEEGEEKENSYTHHTHAHYMDGAHFHPELPCNHHVYFNSPSTLSRSSSFPTSPLVCKSTRVSCSSIHTPPPLPFVATPPPLHYPMPSTPSLHDVYFQRLTQHMNFVSRSVHAMTSSLIQKGLLSPFHLPNDFLPTSSASCDTSFSLPSPGSASFNTDDAANVLMHLHHQPHQQHFHHGSASR